MDKNELVLQEEGGERLVEVEVECEEDEDKNEDEDEVVLVSYSQLVDDSNLFYRQLSLFHSSSSSTTSSPSLSLTLAGTLLDLHRLFLEVTSRGGLLQVIKDRKWKHVVSAFQFPPSQFSSTSFLLRKYYVSLLYHFEHLYFFRNTTSSSPPPLSSSPLSTDYANCLPAFPPTPQSTTPTPSPASTQMPLGVSFVGVIDEKFDNGYVVSVNVGSDQLRGILYHIPDTPQPTLPPKQNISDLALMDPSKRKLNGNPDNFSTGRYAALTPISQEQEAHISDSVGHQWNISPVTK